MQLLDNTSPKLERDSFGRLLPGQQSLNPNGRPKGSVSIKDAIRKHLEENPETVKEFVMHFVKNNKELAWQMLEGRPGQELRHAGPDGDHLGEPSQAIKDIAQKLNEVLGTGGVAGDGTTSSPVDTQTPNQNE